MLHLTVAYQKTKRAGVICLAALLLVAACGPVKKKKKPPFQAQPTSTPRDSQRFHNKKFYLKLPYNFQVPDDQDELAWRILSDYGAVYVAQGVTAPPVVRFNNAEEVNAWQETLKTERLEFGEQQYGNFVELQAQAMTEFKAARAEIEEMGLSLTPRGSDAGRRSYEDTVKLWESRVSPGLDHWVNLGRLPLAEANRIKTLSPTDQVLEILKLENQGLFFSKDFDKSILASVAAPGTSQHLSLLALDVFEYENYDVRLALARRGWYQTIPTDLPHFTFLGVRERQLPELGLKRVIDRERAFWIPDVK
jgi:hypothetical protein